MTAKYEIEEITRPDDDRSGLAKIVTRRLGGMPGNNIFLLYRSEADSSEGFDIALSTLSDFAKSTGGMCLGRWEVMATPKAGHYGCAGVEINMSERSGDHGFLEKRADGPFSVAVQITPENAVNLGSGHELCSNISFGTVYTSSGARPDNQPARIHCPICVEPGGIADGGTGILMHGKSDNQVNAPGFVGQFIGTFKRGLSFVRTNFIDKIAIALKPGQKIDLGHGQTISQEETVPSMFLNIGNRFSLYEAGEELWARYKKADGTYNFKKVM